jgi:hypothetical protein
MELNSINLTNNNSFFPKLYVLVCNMYSVIVCFHGIFQLASLLSNIEEYNNVLMLRRLRIFKKLGYVIYQLPDHELTKCSVGRGLKPMHLVDRPITYTGTMVKTTKPFWVTSKHDSHPISRLK